MPRSTHSLSNAMIATLAILGIAAGVAGSPGDGYLGVLFAREDVEVSAEVAGIIREVHVGLGDKVERGQPLISLESADLVSSLRQARAARSTAEARADHAAAELADVERLLARRRAAAEVFTREEVEALETRAEIARSELEATRSTVAERVAAVRELERRVEALVVSAPITGAVAACHHDVGVRVSAGEALVRLISSEDVWVRFAVPSTQSAWLALGLIVRVGTNDASGGCTAEIRRIAPEVDPATDMVFVEASLIVPENEEASLRAGEIVRVRPRD